MDRNLASKVNDVKKAPQEQPRPIGSVIRTTPDRHHATACKTSIKLGTWNVKTMNAAGTIESMQAEMSQHFKNE